MTIRQRYAVATMLATNTLPQVERRLQLAISGGYAEPWALDFAREIDRHYRRRDGFVPAAVRQIVNNPRPA